MSFEGPKLETKSLKLEKYFLKLGSANQVWSYPVLQVGLRTSQLTMLEATTEIYKENTDTNLR